MEPAPRINEDWVAWRAGVGEEPQHVAMKEDQPRLETRVVVTMITVSGVVGGLIGAILKLWP